MQVLDASDYGVPQNRKRAIMVGIRQDFLEEVFDFGKLRKQKKVTVYEALSDLYDEEKDLMKQTQMEEKELAEVVEKNDAEKNEQVEETPKKRTRKTI